MKKTDDVKLYIARLINEENADYSKLLQNLNLLSSLESTKRLIETLAFSHKEKIDLLEKIYNNI